MRRPPLAEAAGPALLLLALLGACGGGADPRHDVSSDVTRCKERMRAIHDGLCRYGREHGGPPQASGVAFLAELLASGALGDPAESAEFLQCPGPGARAPDAPPDLTAPETLDGADSTYAVRDTEQHPLAAYPIGPRVPILACDNSAGMNHEGVMNVLYGDGTVVTLELAKLIADGKVPAGTTNLAVGPDSPLEELRVLTPD